MALINISKPTTTLTNSTKVSHEETWNSNVTTWDTETRTWSDMASLFDGFAKPSTSITNVAKPA